MKKTFIFCDFLFIISILGLTKESFSQNVGIGTVTPFRAKLEVYGAAGSGYTSAMFGSDGAGISIQRNGPTIGFNQYNDGGSKFMTTGYAAIQHFDPATGAMAIDMLGTGTANTPAITLTRALTISNTGNVSIKTTPINASLYVIKGSNFDGSAIFGGTTYGSFFNYSNNEDTYIRGGIAGSNVIINDIANGNIQMGNGSSRVGINTLPYVPATALEVNGALSLRSRAENIVDNTTIVVGDRSFISLINNIYPAIPQFFLSDGINSGQILILLSDFNNGVAGIDLADGPNIKLAGGGFRLQREETLTLIWSGSKWIELSRSNNF